MKTAEEFYKQKYLEASMSIDVSSEKQLSLYMMVEFTKFHVEAALKLAAEEAKLNLENDCYGNSVAKNFSSTEREQGFSSHTSVFVNKESIINAYPLSNIK